MKTIKLENGGRRTIFYRGVEKYFDKYNRTHRIDGPAVIYEDGSQYWFKEGVWHRENGPACINNEGRNYWVDGHWHPKFNVFLIALSKSLDLNEFWK